MSSSPTTPPTATTTDKKPASANNTNHTAATPLGKAGAAGFDWPLIKRFISFLLPYKTEVLLGIALIPFSVLFSVLYPWLIMRIIDVQLIPGKYEGLWLWGAALILVLLANYISDAIYNYSLQKAAQKAIMDLQIGRAHV